MRGVPVMPKTESELLFEAFGAAHHLDCTPIPPGSGKSLDYRLRFGFATVLVEIEQIESRKGFNPSGVHTRNVGWHVRHKISEARRQLKTALTDGLPAILLVHNTIDPLQAFGTETHDFIGAMYGDLTVRLMREKPPQWFHGRNSKLRRDANTSFSGVGHLKRVANGAEVRIFENVYAEHPLPFEELPSCFDVVRVEIEDAA
jgi:hypothetical protein